MRLVSCLLFVIIQLTACSGGGATSSTPALSPQTGSATKDLVYRVIPGVDPNLLSLDIYQPPTVITGGSPVMIMIHGGSYVHGDKAGEAGVDRPPLLYPKMEYYTARGWVFVSINYRLTSLTLPLGHPQQVTHPMHIEDVAAAVAWLHENIGRYGGDAHKLVVVGHSAGVHLAALLATDQRKLAAYGLRTNDLAGVIALDGIYDIPEQMPRAAPFMPLVFGDQEIQWRDASPLYHVEASEPIPPMLIVYNDVDSDNMPRSQSLAFGAALQAAGVAAETYMAVGKTHDQIGEDLGKPGDPLSDTVDQFLSRLGL